MTGIVRVERHGRFLKAVTHALHVGREFTVAGTAFHKFIVTRGESRDPHAGLIVSQQAVFLRLIAIRQAQPQAQVIAALMLLDACCGGKGIDGWRMGRNLKEIAARGRQPGALIDVGTGWRGHRLKIGIVVILRKGCGPATTCKDRYANEY